MVGWVESFEWFVGPLLSFFVFMVPVLATFGAVFLGVYLNGVIDREREREMEVFRPLFKETSQVKDNSGLTPIHPLLEEGNHRSVLLDIRPMDIHLIDQKTQEKVIAYLEAVKQLAKLDDRILSASALLHESGYGEYLTDQLPDEMLMQSDEGIGAQSSTSIPGPHIVVGRRTVIAGPNAILPSKSTQVSGDHRRALLPILVEYAPLFAEADSPAELRDAVDSHTEIEVDYLDEKCPNWAQALWEVLQRPWESEQIEYDEGTFGGNVVPEDQHQNIIQGDDFEGILASAGVALQLRRIKCREEVINCAEELHERLLARISQPLYHPNRILLARRRAVK